MTNRLTLVREPHKVCTCPDCCPRNRITPEVLRLFMEYERNTHGVRREIENGTKIDPAVQARVTERWETANRWLHTAVGRMLEGCECR